MLLNMKQIINRRHHTLDKSKNNHMLMTTSRVPNSYHNQMFKPKFPGLKTTKRQYYLVSAQNRLKNKSKAKIKINRQITNVVPINNTQIPSKNKQNMPSLDTEQVQKQPTTPNHKIDKQKYFQQMNTILFPQRQSISEKNQSKSKNFARYQQAEKQRLKAKDQKQLTSRLKKCKIRQQFKLVDFESNFSSKNQSHTQDYLEFKQFLMVSIASQTYITLPFNAKQNIHLLLVLSSNYLSKHTQKRLADYVYFCGFLGNYCHAFFWVGKPIVSEERFKIFEIINQYMRKERLNQSQTFQKIYFVDWHGNISHFQFHSSKQL